MKTAIVVGATGEIGGAIASLLVEKDFHVICFGRDKTKLSSLKKDLGENVSTFSVDLRDTENLEMMISDIKLQYKKIDLVVGAAGFFEWDNESPSLLSAISKISEANFDSKARFYDSFKEVFKPKGVVFKFVGSHIADEKLFSDSDIEKFGEVAYAYAMKNLRKWVAQKKREDIDNTILISEPGLIDTAMARRKFTKERLGYEPDWQRESLKPEDYANIFWKEDLEEIFQ